MRPHTPLFAFLLVAGSLALPLVAQAGGIPFFGPIIDKAWMQCPLGWGALITVINNIISLLITIAIVFVAPLMIAWAGFLFVVSQGDSGKRTEARKILTNTIVGIVIALSGWMIVDAIMVVLYNPGADVPGGKIGAWSSLIKGSNDFCLIQEASLKQLNQVNITGSTAQGGLTTTSGPGQLRNGFALGCTTSNDQNATELASVGVSGRSTSNCCTKTQSTCTSLDGINLDTIKQIKNIQTKCGGVVVTGGTEVGHSNAGGINHSGGSKIDIATNVDSCITSYTTVAGTRSDGAALRKDSCGNIYARETSPPHWDIAVTAVCSL